ncbi:hypothetical protein GGQ73_003625 [Rhizobium skierniewicense]|uniref:Uncharacterized protein n=1 Tax=Rhizobium skierniewicense TaxID=984260 RepID=A0A7W6CD35_9HYPH|nr:hypothetical protein [Rhizobium skierniewicense]
MRAAWHPTRDELILAKDLEREYGDRIAEDGDLFLQPTGIRQWRNDRF